jgi:excisionase family DNA binding protein
MQTYDITQVAKLLNCEPSTVTELAVEGALKGAKIGRSWVFMEEHVTEYLREQVQAQTLKRKRARKPIISAENIEPSIYMPRERRSGGRKRPPALPEPFSEITAA